MQQLDIFSLQPTNPSPLVLPAARPSQPVATIQLDIWQAASLLVPLFKHRTGEGKEDSVRFRIADREDDFRVAVGPLRRYMIMLAEQGMRLQISYQREQDQLVLIHQLAPQAAPRGRAIIKPWAWLTRSGPRHRAHPEQRHRTIHLLGA